MNSCTPWDAQAARAIIAGKQSAPGALLPILARLMANAGSAPSRTVPTGSALADALRRAGMAVPRAAMLAANALISAVVCGTLRTFFGDFFSLFSGTNTMSLLAAAIFVLSLMVLSFGYGVLRRLRA